MKYISTRGASPAVSSARAVVDGLAPDGGLYTMSPSDMPKLDWRRLISMDYYSMAAGIISALLPDFSRDEARDLTGRAYNGKFPSADIAPTVPVGDKAVLELFHGPTSAFKDVALCLLPYLMKSAAEKCGDTGTITILTATSGDTGKAALEGFRDVPGIKIAVFYPRDGVSAVQKAQMVTQEGRNVHVCAVDGNFDDAQSGVKRIFGSIRGRGLSSANSINIGRLVPQVVYYFSAYASLVKSGRLLPGAPLDFCVPTGNFGDILAGYIAGEMGLPLGRLVCASNENNVLTDFLRTGTYDRRRHFCRTLSPSMDILISSNLERLLFLMSGDSALVASLMRQLADVGRYTVPSSLLEKIQRRFWAGCCDDEGTKATVARVWHSLSYLCDTHTAVAWNVAEQYEKAVPDHNPIVVLSTASPYKFPAAVLSAVGGVCGGDEFEMMSALEKTTGVPMPANLRGLRERPCLHNDCVEPSQMSAYVLDLLEDES